jgi:hypothetical protein
MTHEQLEKYAENMTKNKEKIQKLLAEAKKKMTAGGLKEAAIECLRKKKLLEEKNYLINNKSNKLIKEYVAGLPFQQLEQKIGELQAEAKKKTAAGKKEEAIQCLKMKKIVKERFDNFQKSVTK